MLILHGRDDKIWPIKNAITLKEGLGKKADINIYEKVGHVLAKEKSDEINEKLLNFLSND